ncbi:RNA polymerase sigma factor [Solirubrobacter phytolaccae]|uniref:RNA polymerase sigma factor n=1 Tax=Solirubrobacter phytolaccae TaxID=1404360 RepID=A0A9X3N7T1_9ACTN|nr:RNA polymerase sigma factor [Solirubrobacter phytolaccae]MDA0180045.1 RNA polymerase sigma factor [Solirubrobacter phytolaccae]
MADDRDLLKRIARGDERAFSAFYRAHLDAVVAYLRRRVPEPELAFDLAAETFAVVALRADTYGGDGPPAAWLFGIARNKLRESLRRGRVEDEARRALGLEPVALEDEALARVEERAAAGGPALARLLAQLPEPTRAALLARVVDERPYEEIAVVLECSEQVVRQRVHRGLARLRAGLEGDDA